MRRVRFSAAMSLDGCIAGPNGEFNWITIDPDIDFAAMYASYSHIVMGRHSYEVFEATGGGVFWTRGGGLLGAIGSGVDLPRISMLTNARVLAGSGWLGLKDREAFVTRGVRLIPMFTGFLALAALLALLAATWWREGR